MTILCTLRNFHKLLPYPRTFLSSSTAVPLPHASPTPVFLGDDLPSAITFEFGNASYFDGSGTTSGRNVNLGENYMQNAKIKFKLPGGHFLWEIRLSSSWRLISKERAFFLISDSAHKTASEDSTHKNSPQRNFHFRNHNTHLHMRLKVSACKCSDKSLLAFLQGLARIWPRTQCNCLQKTRPESARDLRLVEIGGCLS